MVGICKTTNESTNRIKQINLMNNPPSPFRLLPTSLKLRRTGLRDRITNILWLKLLLLGATALGMNDPGEQLLGAVVNGDFEEVKRLIAYGASVEAENSYGLTPLMMASAYGHEAICRLLIARGASVEAKNNYERTALTFAAQEGHEGVCKLLIANRATIEVKDNRGWTPLVYAAEFSRDAVCKLLINIQLEPARKNKPAIATFLGIVRNRKQNLPCDVQKDIAQIIVRQVLQLAQCLVIEQIKEIKTPEIEAQWLAYVKQPMNSPIKKTE